MTPDEIAADRAVIDAATDGPWWIEQTPDRQSAVVAGAWVTLDWGDPDAAFIAAARTGWPRALDALEVMADAVLDEMTRAEKAEAEVAALRERVADLEGQLAMRGTP